MFTLAEIIERISKSMQDHEESITRESVFANLSVTQIHYLDAIRHLEKPPTVSEIAEIMHVTKPTATNSLDRLEKNGYLFKVSSSDDRRVIFIHLTTKGMQISDLHDKIHQSYADLIKKALTKEELDQIIFLLNKVVLDLGL